VFLRPGSLSPAQLYCAVGPQHEAVYYSIKRWTVVPTRHRLELRSPADVLVVGGKEPALSDEEWEFLTGKVAVADPAWLRPIAEAPAGDPGTTRLARARELARRRGWSSAWASSRSSTRRTTDAFDISRRDSLGADGVRLAQIAAKVDAVVRSSFMYLCQDGEWRPVSDGLVSGNDAAVEELFPKSWLAARTVSDGYTAGLSQGELVAWGRWASTTARSGLHDFPIPNSTGQWIYSRDQLGQLCVQRGGHPPLSYQYRDWNYLFADYDYEDSLWQYWRRLAEKDRDFWVRLARALLAAWSDDVWGLRAEASASERSRGGWQRKFDHGTLVARWCTVWSTTQCSATLPSECLPDTFGRRHRPA
jgi:hypothetical protein